MSDEMIITIGGFLVMAIAVVKPIINLNTSITELKSSIDSFRDAIKELKDRTSEHGRELDKVREKLENHEVRIKQLEK